MKNFVSLFVILLVCISCWIPVASAQDEVTFNDPVFRDVVNGVLQLSIKDINAPITRAHMAHPDFTELSQPTRPFWDRPLITDLTGIEHATSLTSLNLSNQEVSDISPLAGLTNLETLRLTANSISDISPLAGLTNLEEFYAYDNNISDIRPLANLTKLTILHLARNSISVIPPLANLTELTELYLSQNSVRDIQGLKGLTNLAELHASDNQIRDISSLQGLTALQEVYLTKNKIRDISPIAGWTHLRVTMPPTGRRNPALFFMRSGSFFYINGTNPLSYPSIYKHMPTIISRNPALKVPGSFGGFRYGYPLRVPLTLESVSGDGQTVVSGEALPEPLVVRVLDENDERFAGVPVTFAVTEGEGTMDPAETAALDPTYNLRYEEEGEAQTTFTAGESIGQQTVVATVTHEDTTLQVTFTINVEPDAIAAPTIATVDPPPTHHAARKVGRAFVCRAKLRNTLSSCGQRGVDS